jgi:uncharacterized protein YndB with AHSA1/START domain
MDKNLKVSKQITINAPQTKVWDALTNPAKMSRYLFSLDTVTDWQPGTPIIFKGEYEGQPYEDKGNVIENNGSTLLKYEYWNSFAEMDDVPENYTVVTYTLQAIDDNTTLFTWTQEGFYDEDWRDEFEMILETETLLKVKQAAEE